MSARDIPRPNAEVCNELNSAYAEIYAEMPRLAEARLRTFQLATGQIAHLKQLVRQKHMNGDRQAFDELRKIHKQLARLDG